MTVVNHSWRTTWPDSVPESGSARLTAVLRDEAGDPVPGASLASATLTLFNRITSDIINGWDESDILASVDSDGVLTVDLGPDDNPISTAGRALEWHVARIRYAWDGGDKQGFHEMHFPVVNLALIPA
jgi:hypothetical protein